MRYHTVPKMVLTVGFALIAGACSSSRSYETGAGSYPRYAEAPETRPSPQTGMLPPQRMPSPSSSSSLGRGGNDSWRSADGSTSPYRWNGNDQRIQEGRAPVPFTASPAPIRTASIASNKPAAAGGRSVTVVAGDTLYGIARRNNVTVQQLARANGIADGRVHAGQVLQLP